MIFQKGNVDNNLPQGTEFKEDLAYKVGSQVDDLESSTTYTVNVRVLKSCSVNAASSDSLADETFYTALESGSAYSG